MVISTEVQIVDNYLQLCEERNLSEAAKYLADDVQLVFPGGTVFEDLPTMVADGTRRYGSIRKHRTEFFIGNRTSDGAQICISTGTLDGNTLWGTAFSGIRYIDLFVIRDGLIYEQYVWNDLAETGVVPLLPQRASSPSTS